MRGTIGFGLLIMKTVIQRVNYASVKVDGNVIGTIDKGLLVFIGIKKDDTRAEIEWMADKVKKLRIFEDENGKMNLSATDLGLEYLLISQFTLYGECKKGTRPSFTEAAPPDIAIPLYEYFIELIRKDGANAPTGIFGADMKITSENDGPVTVILEKNHDQV